MHRRYFIGAAGSLLFARNTHAQVGHSGMEALLSDALAGEHLPVRRAALEGSIRRLRHTVLPAYGRLVVVNTASCMLAAYEDGKSVLEMKTACGMPRSPTPMMSDNAGSVIFNPLWTMPASIAAEHEWKADLADPVFRRKYGFSVHNGKYVQKSGSLNLLGTQKISFASGGSIYLHDTSEPAVFMRSRRLVTHGCVRLEKPYLLSSWMLGISEKAAREKHASGYSAPIRPEIPVTVTLCCFTAWPDAAGRIVFSPDEYGLDRVSSPSGRI